MKANYEDRFRYLIPRRGFTIIRLDGVAFHTYTRGLKRPFDEIFIADMDNTAKYLCERIQGAKFAFVQSDEISILLTDFDRLTTDAWFDGNLQKMCSVSASMATAVFNQLRPGKLAYFDSRVFTLPYAEEVINYYIWRQQDCTRNSVTAVAQSLYSHKELMGKSNSDKQELIFQRGQNWNDYPARQKRGGAILQKIKTVDGVDRHFWDIVEAPIFSQQREFFNLIFPIML